MQTTEKRRVKASLYPILLSTSLLVKKQAAAKQKPTTTVDFHLEVVRKIDEILKEPKPQRQTVPTAADQINRMPPPVEERSPFTRHPSHTETLFDAHPSPLSRPYPIPEEFKADFPIGTNPSFKFVTSLDSVEDYFVPKHQNDDRVEIIDLNSLREKPAIMRTRTSPIDDDIASPHHAHDDIAFLSAMTNDMPESQMNRTQLYTLQAKTKEKQDDYIPDLSERIQQIKERQQEEEKHRKEEEQRHQVEEQEEQQEEEEELRREQEKQEAEAKKQKEREEKERKKQQQKKTGQPPHQPAEAQDKPSLFHRAKPQTTPAPPEEPDEPASCEPEESDTPEEPEEPEIPDEPIGPATDKLSKKEQKLAARQAKLEEKRQRQHEKLMEKERRKQEKLKSKAAKHNKNKKTKPTTKAKQTTPTAKPSRSPKKPQTTEEYDEDLLRFLQVADTLLGQLPEDVIERFANSEDFQLYEKIMAKYHLK